MFILNSFAVTLKKSDSHLDVKRLTENFSQILVSSYHLTQHLWVFYFGIIFSALI